MSSFRTKARLLTVLSGTVVAGMLMQGAGSAAPGELFPVSWGSISTSGSTCTRTASSSPSGTQAGENIQSTLYATVLQGTTLTTYTGSTTTIAGGGSGTLTSTVSYPCSNPVVFDFYIQGYRPPIATPDYILDQSHAFSVCTLPLPNLSLAPVADINAGCVNDDEALPLILNTPPDVFGVAIPHTFIGHFPVNVSL